MAVLPLCLFALRPLAAQSVPRFEPGPCPFEGEWLARETINCGVLVVAESRGRPEARTLRLAVAILRSAARAPRPDPVVFLSGGPGQAALRLAPSFSTSRFWRAIRRERDVVLWDQRGTGYSEPTFCREESAHLISVEYGAIAEDPVSAAVRIVSRCRERMLAEGLDFAAYNSAVSARDLDDLRRTLGYERWNVLGVSYGTRLALTAAREVPHGIRSLILDSTEPPDAGPDDNVLNLARSLDLVFHQCEADAACRAAFPGLEAELYAAIDELNAEPLTLPVSDTTLIPGGRLILDGRIFALGIFRALYERQLIPLLPHAIRQIRQRNVHLLASLAGALADDPETLNPWLRYTVECYEKAPLVLSAAVATEVDARHPRLAPVRDTILSAVCAAWHRERADTALLRRPVTADLPALIVAGEFDPVTPPRYGRRVSESLPRSQYFEVRGMAHGVLPFTACTRKLTLEFLDEPERPLDAACLDELPPIRFIPDLHIEPAIGALMRRMGAGSAIGLGVWSALSLLVLATALVGWPAAAVTRRLRHQPALPRDGRRWARALAGLAALTALGFVLGLAWVVRGVAALNPFVLGFGLPRSAAPLLSVPWLFIALTGAVVAFAAVAWRRNWWGRFARAHFTLVAVACVAFAGLLVHLGLL